ncbi:collagen alpha-6(VI) chain-like [Narcine bancroftii]|uniref:collagen alpha-6(VI) chain-like n=1 Tax=Narcine bancroftii TaxID=1343680 RepID=UPI0038318FE4
MPWNSFNMWLLKGTTIIFFLTVKMHDINSQSIADYQHYSDIVFLVDGSHNVGRVGFHRIRNFILRVVGQLNVGANRYRIGLAQYSEDSQTEFLLNKFLTKQEVTNHLRKKYSFKGGPVARIGRGIEFVHKNHFVKAAGSRKDEGVPQIAVIISATRSQDKVETAAKALKADGVMVISLGIGKAVKNDQIKMAFVQQYPFIVTVEGFNQLLPLARDMSTAIKTITQKHFVLQEIERPAVCQTASMADIVFLVEESSRIKVTKFELIRDFLEHFISVLDIGSEKVRVGLLRYGTVLTPEFYFTSYQKMEDVLKHVKSIRFTPAKDGRINAGGAIRYIHENYFVARAGSRKQQGVPQIAIMITHGDFNDDVRGPAAALRRIGVLVYTIGMIGTQSNKLRNVASYPPENFILNIENIGHSKNIEKIIQKKICVGIVHVTSVRSEQTDQLQQTCTQSLALHTCPKFSFINFPGNILVKKNHRTLQDGKQAIRPH